MNQDFRDLLAEFNAREVEYLVVGAHALAVHGFVRSNRSAEPLCPGRAKAGTLRAWEDRERFVVEGGRTGRRSWRSSSGAASGRLTSARSEAWD